MNWRFNTGLTFAGVFACCPCPCRRRCRCRCLGGCPCYTLPCTCTLPYDIDGGGNGNGNGNCKIKQVYRANYGVLNQHRKRPRSFAGRDGEYLCPDPSATATATATAAAPLKRRQPSSAFVGLPCHSSVTAVCWMPDGQKFLTAGQDGLVKVEHLDMADRQAGKAGRQADDVDILWCPLLPLDS